MGYLLLGFIASPRTECSLISRTQNPQNSGFRQCKNCDNLFMLWVGPYLWISLSTTDSAPPCSALGLDEMVWTAANRYLREKYPGIHLGLKRAASPWLRRDINVRIPKR